MELQERKLFEYFLVVALHKTKAGVPYLPEVTQQFPLKVQTFFLQKQNKSNLSGLEDVHITLKRSVNVSQGSLNSCICVPFSSLVGTKF